jgi:hypothetical protein
LFITADEQNMNAQMSREKQIVQISILLLLLVCEWTTNGTEEKRNIELNM